MGRFDLHALSISKRQMVSGAFNYSQLLALTGTAKQIEAMELTDGIGPAFTLVWNST